MCELPKEKRLHTLKDPNNNRIKPIKPEVSEILETNRSRASQQGFDNLLLANPGERKFNSGTRKPTNLLS